MFLGRHRKRMREGDDLQVELGKIKPPTFDGENKKGEDVKAWLLAMRKYLQLHNYSYKMNARISIYNLEGKYSIWWEQLVQVQTCQ